jgi:hypothetical protein
VREKLKQSLARFRDLFLEYGIIALIVHYVIFAIVIVGFWAAIRAGWRADSTAGSIGTWGAAYIAAKITQPLRIVATLALTPVVARLYERVTGKSARQAESRQPQAEIPTTGSARSSADSMASPPGAA